MAEPLFTDRALQAQYRALIDEAPGDDHLDEGTWDLIVSGEIEPARRDAAFDHVVACGECSRIWRGVLALKEDAEAQQLIAREPTATAGWRSQLIPLAAAAVLVLSLGGLYLTRSRSIDPDAMRNGGTMVSIEALMVAYTPEGVPAFVWAPVADASRYRVEVFTDDGRPVWSREVERAPAAWPADVPRASATYRWRVEAIRGDEVVARSPITSAEISR